MGRLTIEEIEDIKLSMESLEVDEKDVSSYMTAAVLKKMGYSVRVSSLQSKGKKKGSLTYLTHGSNSFIFALICVPEINKPEELQGLRVNDKSSALKLVIQSDGYKYNVYEVAEGVIVDCIFSMDLENITSVELDDFSDLSFDGDYGRFILEIKKKYLQEFIKSKYLNPDKETFDYIAQRLNIPNTADFKMKVLDTLTPLILADKVSTKKSKIIVDTVTELPVTNIVLDIESILSALKAKGLKYYPDSSYKTGYRLQTPDSISFGAYEFEFKTWRDAVIQILTQALNSNKGIRYKFLRHRVGMSLNFFASEESINTFCEELSYKNGEQGIKQLSDDLWVYIWANPTMAIVSVYALLTKVGVNLDTLAFDYMF